MLICNNCNTLNDEGTHKCKHCHMTGDFRSQMGENKSDNTPILISKIVCRNCGSDAPGEGHQCVHCKFPLAAVKTARIATKVVENGFQPSAIHSSAKRN